MHGLCLYIGCCYNLRPVPVCLPTPGCQPGIHRFILVSRDMIFYLVTYNFILQVATSLPSTSPSHPIKIFHWFSSCITVRYIGNTSTSRHYYPYRPSTLILYSYLDISSRCWWQTVVLPHFWYRNNRKKNHCLPPLLVVRGTTINSNTVHYHLVKPANAGGKQWFFAVFNTEREANLLFAASIDWKWSIKNKVYAF